MVSSFESYENDNGGDIESLIGQLDKDVSVRRKAAIALQNVEADIPKRQNIEADVPKHPKSYLLGNMGIGVLFPLGKWSTAYDTGGFGSGNFGHAFSDRYEFLMS